MKVYLNDDKTHVDSRPHNDILWGLKAHCGYVPAYIMTIWHYFWINQIHDL